MPHPPQPCLKQFWQVIKILEKDLKIIGWIFCRTILQIKNKLCHFNFPLEVSFIVFILFNAFRLNQCHHLLYKYLCLCFNKSVLNWTLCQSLFCPKKNPIAQKDFDFSFRMVVDTPVQVPVTQSEPEVENRTNGNGNDDGGSSGGEEIENVHRYSICNFFFTLSSNWHTLASSRNWLSLLTKKKWCYVISAT
jgi:hypothetical protein